MMDTVSILLVDDNELVLNVTARYLRRAGLNVLTAQDGASAERHLAEGDIDAVVTDFNLPGRDPWFEFLHTQTHRTNLLVLIVAGGDVPITIADQYPVFNKPLDFVELHAALSTLDRAQPPKEAPRDGARS